MFPNGTVYLMRPRPWGPVDRAALKVVVTTDAIGRPEFIGHREAKQALLPAQARPLGKNAAVHEMRAGRRRRVHPAIAEALPVPLVARRRRLPRSGRVRMRSA